LHKTPVGTLSSVFAHRLCGTLYGRTPWLGVVLAFRALHVWDRFATILQLPDSAVQQCFLHFDCDAYQLLRLWKAQSRQPPASARY
jgi:hypothetical protein